jgi:hypothetical protein
MSFSQTFQQQMWIMAAVTSAIAFYLYIIKLKIYKW